MTAKRPTTKRRSKAKNLDCPVTVLEKIMRDEEAPATARVAAAKALLAHRAELAGATEPEIEPIALDVRDDRRLIWKGSEGNA